MRTPGRFNLLTCPPTSAETAARAAPLALPMRQRILRSPRPPHNLRPGVIAPPSPQWPPEEPTRSYPPGTQCFMVADWEEADGRPGAMWYADEAWNGWKGPDGRAIYVNCPNGRTWCIDSRAKNCTMPTDNAHRCWIRHGIPPNLTVDKSGGTTCAAGAGSIVCGDYHGFLRNGSFT